MPGTGASSYILTSSAEMVKTNGTANYVLAGGGADMDKMAATTPLFLKNGTDHKSPLVFANPLGGGTGLDMDKFVLSNGSEQSKGSFVLSSNDSSRASYVLSNGDVGKTNYVLSNGDQNKNNFVFNAGDLTKGNFVINSSGDAASKPSFFLSNGVGDLSKGGIALGRASDVVSKGNLVLGDPTKSVGGGLVFSSMNGNNGAKIVSLSTGGNKPVMSSNTPVLLQQANPIAR